MIENTRLARLETAVEKLDDSIAQFACQLETACETIRGFGEREDDYDDRVHGLNRKLDGIIRMIIYRKLGMKVE